MHKSLLMRLGMVVLVLGLVGSLSCSKKGGGGDDADDGNTPYRILDVSVSAVTDSSVTMIWTATGDDADQGTASSYDVRRWHSLITDANWDSATQLAGEPYPSPAGQRDSMKVTGLKEDSTYFFALHVCDEASNCTSSNCVSGTCFADMAIVFADAHLDSAVRVLIAKLTGSILRSDLMSHDFLDVNYAGIASLGGMESWKHLAALLAAGNSITDLSPLSGLINLRGLGLTGNGLVNINPVSNLVNLEILHLRTNSIVNISPLVSLPKLHQLDLTANDITDLSPLVANSGLAAADTIWVGENPLSPQSLTVDIPALQARGVVILGL